MTTDLDAVRDRFPDVRVVEAARTKRASIAAFYRALDAPEYAATNYDAFADVLRDLGWLPPGPVALAWRVGAELPAPVREELLDILRDAVEESAAGERPLTLHLIR